MSQGTTKPLYDVAARRTGLVVLGAAVLAALMVQSHGKVFGSAWNPGVTGQTQLFSWAQWILVLLMVICAAVLLSSPDPTRLTIVAAAGLVPASMVAGAGIVARRRWHPVAGPGPGLFTNQRGLVLVATVAALAAIFAMLALLHLLWRAGRLDGSLTCPAPVRAASVAVALAVAVSVPFLVGLGRLASHDLTSRGAFVMLWSLPWGGVLALTGWLPRAPAIAIGLTVAVCAVSAYPACDIVNVQHHVIPVLVGVVAGLLVAGLHAATGRPDRATAGEPLPPVGMHGC
jgi:hypothetical protein